MAKHQSKFSKFLNEVRRRKVVRVIIVYATTAFILLQVVDILVNNLPVLPNWLNTSITILLIIGLPIAIILTWAFNMTPKEKCESKQLRKENLCKNIPKDKSIIVLPFENISSDPEQDYFSDGLTEEIITDLSYIQDLLVISRSSAMTFKKSKFTIKEIVERVNVKYVLEGSVRKSKNNLRIVAQLIDGSNDSHIWGEKYDGSLDDIFDIQEKVSHAIAKELRIKLSTDESIKIEKKKVDNVQVYESYLKSKQDLWKSSEESLIRAEKNLKNGLQFLGSHELLYIGLGQVYFQFYDTGIRHDEVYLNKVENYINKVFEIQPNSAAGYRLLGQVKLKRENSLVAYKYFQKSYELNPSDSETLMWLIYIQCIHLGRPKDAFPFVKKMLEIDPLTPINQGGLATYYWMNGQFKEALIYEQNWFEMEPDSLLAQWYLGTIMILNEDYNDAYKLIDRAIQKTPDDLFTKLLLLLKYSVQRRKKEVVNILTDEVREIAWEDFHLPWYIADCYSLIGETDQSIIWLERAVEKGFINYPLFSEIDPFLENVRGEARFIKLMKKVKIQRENFDFNNTNNKIKAL